jgi:hypothetical protein
MGVIISELFTTSYSQDLFPIHHIPECSIFLAQSDHQHESCRSMLDIRMTWLGSLYVSVPFNSALHFNCLKTSPTLSLPILLKHTCAFQSHCKFNRWSSIPLDSQAKPRTTSTIHCRLLVMFLELYHARLLRQRRKESVVGIESHD